AGARIAVPDGDTRLIAARLQRWLIAERITMTDLPAALVEQLLGLAWPADAALQVMLSGGDRLVGRPAEGMRWQLYNQDGPTVAALRGHAGVADAHVRLVGGALVAYVVPRDDRAIPANAALRAHLAARLPEPLIPAAFVILHQLPVTERGKVDVRALPAPLPH